MERTELKWLNRAAGKLALLNVVMMPCHKGPLSFQRDHTERSTAAALPLAWGFDERSITCEQVALVQSEFQAC